jgi:hypothetical protein
MPSKTRTADRLPVSPLRSGGVQVAMRGRDSLLQTGLLQHTWVESGLGRAGIAMDVWDGSGRMVGHSEVIQKRVSRRSIGDLPEADF